MLSGEVTDDDIVQIQIPVAGRIWPAMIDTGFNGSLELPEELFQWLRPEFVGVQWSSLAGGQEIEEDIFQVDFLFDGLTVAADATFVETDMILIGTTLLRKHRLEVNFVARTLILERVAAA